MKAALLNPSSCLIVPLSSGHSLVWKNLSADSSCENTSEEREVLERKRHCRARNPRDANAMLDYVTSSDGL